MTSIRGRGCLCQERTFEDLSWSSPLPESSHDKGPIGPLVEPHVAKSTEEDLQKILKTVLIAQAPPSDDPRKKPIKPKSPDVYCGKSHIKCYSLCQQCEDYFATVGAKDPYRILFIASFLCNHINFCWQQYKRKYKAESIVPITWKEFKTLFCQSPRDSQAFVNSYWA